MEKTEKVENKEEYVEETFTVRSICQQMLIAARGMSQKNPNRNLLMKARFALGQLDQRLIAAERERDELKAKTISVN